jgi:hypothetical protein
MRLIKGETYYTKPYRKGLEKVLSEWETERPHGEWVEFKGGYYKCDKCGEVERAKKNFCSKCGVDMRGKENDI